MKTHTRAPLLRVSLEEIIVDNFAGGGGASTGIHAALGRSPDIAINHDVRALAMHKANHPETQHFCEDVWKVDPRKVCRGRRVALGWFSPDCKHFSKAKGGRPVDKKVRGLAWLVIRWAKAFPEGKRPRVIVLENVEEFKTWGPLLPDGRPDPAKKGLTFKIWKGKLEALGYTVDFRELRASEYGTPTIRKRLFLVARCDGEQPAWPKKTNGKGLKPVRTAAECIDWNIPCPSIFDRKKPLAAATLRRIAKGIQRFVLENGDPFIVPLTHQGGDRAHSIDDPFRTITGANRGELALATANLARIGQTGGNGDYINDVRDPITTVTTKAEHLLVKSTLIQTGYGERKGQAPRVPGLDKPLGTIVAGGQKHALVSAFLAKHFGGMVGIGIDTPLPTVTTKGCQNQIVTSNLVKFYGTSKSGADVREPMPTVTANGKGGGHIAEVRAFLTQYYGDGGGQEADLFQPMRTIRTKHCLALVTIHGEEYAITDIGMRMLTPRELFRAQGFPEDYTIEHDHEGKPLTKTDQVRMCGNSVCPPLAAAVIAANFPEHNELRRAA